MTTRDKRKVESALTRKGFRKDDTHHHRFIHYTADGKATGIRTHTSHGNRPKALDNRLIKNMAEQCSLSKSDFLRLVDCDMTGDEYQQLVAARSATGR